MLQRPADVLALTRTSFQERTVGGRSVRVLWLHQSKTGREVHIEVTPGLDAVLARCRRAATTLHATTLVHNRAGERYTVDGIVSIMAATKSRQASHRLDRRT